MTHLNHLSIYIDPTTNDIALDALGNLRMCHGAEAIAQHVRKRLMTFEGEWFLDVTAGVMWFARLHRGPLGANYNPALAEATVKGEIFETEGVVGITSFSVSFDRDTRNLKIRDIEITTVYDEEEAVAV